VNIYWRLCLLDNEKDRCLYFTPQYGLYQSGSCHPRLPSCPACTSCRMEKHIHTLTPMLLCSAPITTRIFPVFTQPTVCNWTGSGTHCPPCLSETGDEHLTRSCQQRACGRDERPPFLSAWTKRIICCQKQMNKWTTMNAVQFKWASSISERVMQKEKHREGS